MKPNTRTKPKPLLALAPPIAEPRWRAPLYLAPATRRWFSRVCRTYELEEHHIRLLTAAAEAWDRLQGARAVIAKDGMTYNDRWACPHARPEVAIERDARIAFARLLRELALDVDVPEPARPPGIGSRRRP